MMLTKLKIGATAPDHPLPHHSGKSWRLAEGIQPRTRYLFSTSVLPALTAQFLIIIGDLYVAPLGHDHFALTQA